MSTADIQKKRFASSLLLTAAWPDPLVREAYIHPTADESDEPFHWGFPRLAALRTYVPTPTSTDIRFLHEELSWSISKVDDELTPIVQRIAQRGKGGLSKQTTLLPFFDHSVTGAISYAPRRRTTANMSKRLMGVIKAFREAEAGASVEWGEMLAGVDENDPKGRKAESGTDSTPAPKPPKAKGKGKRKSDATEDDSQPPKKRPARKRAPRKKKDEDAYGSESERSRTRASSARASTRASSTSG